MLSGVPLRSWRQRKALSQRDLAGLAGVGLATIVRIEHGQPARPSTLRKLARAVGVTPEVLIAGPGESALDAKGPTAKSGESVPRRRSPLPAAGQTRGMKGGQQWQM